MTTRSPFARWARFALAGLLLSALLPAAAAAADPTAELRVLTPNRVLDPGTEYVLGPESVTTDPNADCNFGGAGGSGATYDYPKPVGLSLLASGAAARGSLRPLSTSDEFGFGIAVCAIGGVDDGPGTFWYFKRNHRELSVGADQEPIEDGDNFLVYLAPDTFPNPNVKELELLAPARVAAGQSFQVSVVEHGCVTDPNTFAVNCSSGPAAGVTIAGAGGPAITDAAGHATLSAGGAGRLKLAATRAPEIPAKVLTVCVGKTLDDCPAARGKRIVGRADGDRIKGTAGPDKIQARGGADRIDLRKGAVDRVDCGSGRDTVLVRRGDHDDKVGRNCERVRKA
jgi:Ca2+-binding RTX toxin-like protein